MTPGARLAAAAEILTEVVAMKAAADRTISGWGKAHRFAGSKDRAAIAERVYTVLRRRNECAFVLDSDTPRALIIGSLVAVDALDVDRIDALCTDGTHALGALTPHERSALSEPRTPPQGQPWIKLNYPAWLHDEFVAAFGANLDQEIAGLNTRAPLDLRVNALKAERANILEELEREGLAPVACTQAPLGIRLAGAGDTKVTMLTAYRDGRIEIQDEASQLSVVLANAKPGDTVIDLAAGAGGKSLALAAAMANRGRIFACDIEPVRMLKMEPRLDRAGASIVQIAGDPYGEAIKASVGEGADIVFVDAPCSGTGTWRRNPEAKWTLDPARLKTFRAAQAQLLDRAAVLTAPQGRIVYVVCSVLPSESSGQIDAFLARHPGWSVSTAKRFTPAHDGTDGFFAAIFTRTQR
ncbi:MAG: RsmB/NOP family class I SAM-dependent RNA methyltransferase [Alphaproteobacteria bacterium]|nr:RsmB/NOP family class I SAM-dependent RNA methyltransferase [Alphaproteobacteria bacterium]